MDEKKQPFYTPNTWYSITLCPSDSFQYFGKPDRYRKFYNTLYEALLSVHFKYKMYIEISEPRGVIKGNGPRLHTHGILYLPTRKSVKNFLLEDIYKLTRIGIIEIDTIDDMMIWQQYCRKHFDILRFKPLSNHDNLFTEASEAWGVEPPSELSSEVFELKPFRTQPSVRSVDESFTKDSGL